MRETSSVEPAWDDGSKANPRQARLWRSAKGVVASVAPHLFHWAGGRAPQLRVAWGPKEYHLRRDGIVAVDRAEPGWESNPKVNYNSRFERRDDARTTEVPSPPPPPDFSSEALQREVARRMGRAPASTESGSTASGAPEELKARISALRQELGTLDDIKDWARLETVDEELYQLHKAVEYKLRNHKASEAKARLTDLFK